MILQGSLTALATPFTADGVDERAFARLIEWQITEGTTGLVLFGTTGEGSTLTEAERDRLVRISAERAGGNVPIVVDTGTNCTAETIRRTLAARAAGADAALVVTPYYSRPSQDGLYRHFTAVAAAVDLPILLHAVPSRTGVDLASGTVERLAAIPSIIGIADATGDPERPRVTALVAGPGFVQLSGDDASAVTFDLAGGRGCISAMANVAPRLCAARATACLAKDWTLARAIQDRLRPLLAALARESDPGPIKHALSRICPGFPPEPRLPLVGVVPGTAAAIEAALVDLATEAGPALVDAA